MHFLEPVEALLLLGLFGLGMFALVLRTTKFEKHSEGFLVADRCVPAWQAALSIAVSWVWAPAIFICSMQAYTKGLPAIFWFTLPNVVCFFVFAPVAVRLRELAPFGYSLPHYMSEKRFAGDVTAHVAFTVVFFGYQLGAIVINTLAGGLLLHSVSGLDARIATACVAAIALSYSLLSGLKASVFTDVIQMVMVLGISFILVPWSIVAAGGFGVVAMGVGGVDGNHGSLFDPWIALSMGIPMTLSLIAGPLGDQMFFQRAMAVRKNDLVKTFVMGGLLFALIPITLSVLGFLGAGLGQSGDLVVVDAQMVGPAVIAHLLPRVALYAFCLMAFAGLCSTLDSSLCAISSLGGIDVYKRYLNARATDRELLSVSRWFMLGMCVLGTGIALLQPKLLWVFLVYGALASAGFFPTLFSLYSAKITATGVARAITFSLVVGLPLSVYANITENPYLVVIAALLSMGIGGGTCSFYARRSTERYVWEYE